MKKTLVALAALTVVGAVSAQSSVTLYGRIDASIRSTVTKVGGTTTVDPGIKVDSGGHTGSRWGLRGSEDLGGGLKANFQLEQGFSVDTGEFSAATRQFHRQAWVGLSGGFGAIQAGRQYSPLDNLWGTYDAQGYSGYSAMGFAWNAGAAGDVGRINNSLVYSTPAMGGLTAQVMWAPGENKIPAGGVGGPVSAGRHVSGWVNYAAGPLGVAVAYETIKATGATAAVNSWTVGASYDLGVAKLFGGIEGANNKPTLMKDSGWMFGATMPLGSMSLALGYARDKTKTAGVETQKASAFGANLTYPLSKRTYVYGAFLEGRLDVPAPGADTKQRNYGVGLVHNF